MGEVVNLAEYREGRKGQKRPIKADNSIFDPYPFLFTGNAGDRPSDTESHDD